MMRKSDVRRAWCLDARTLDRQAGAHETFSYEDRLEDRWGTEVIGFPAGAEATIEGSMESVTEGVYVSGHINATAEGACVRCLEPVMVPMHIPFQELFAYPDRAAHHAENGNTGDDELREIQADTIDLEPVIRDAVVTALPFQPVCREDCQGLCSECGIVLAEDPMHQHETLDPRWEALGQLATPAQQEKRN